MRPAVCDCPVRAFSLRRALPLLLAVGVSCAHGLAQPQPPPVPRPSGPDRPAGASPDGVAALIGRLEKASLAGDRQAVLALGTTAISRPSFEDFAFTLITPTPTRVAMAERDRAPLADGRSQRLIVEIFAERGIEARLGTWRVDVTPGDTA